MKRCLTLYIIVEMQIKVKMRYHYVLTAPNAGEEVEDQEFSFTAGKNAKIIHHTGTLYDSFLSN